MEAIKFSKKQKTVNAFFFDRYFWKREEESNTKINFLEGMFTYQFSMLVKKSVYDEIGPFNETLIRSQDYEMALRLSRRHQGIFSPHIMFYQREHDGQRGASKDKFSAQDKMKKWMSYDQTFFKQIATDYTLDEFCPTFAKEWNTTIQKRACHLQRGVVMGKYGIWGEAVQDFQAASTLSTTMLSEEEMDLLDQIIRTPTAWELLNEQPGHLRSLSHIYRTNKIGQDMMLGLCRQLLWLSKKSLHNKEIAKFWFYLNLMRKVVGIVGVLKRFWKSFTKA